MNAVDESSPGVVALLLDDLTPPRLGTLLRAARKEHGSTRREVASRVGTTTSELRRYERGETPVPSSVIAALAECYGEALTAQLATRAPIQLDDRRLVVGAVEQTFATDDSDEVLQHYVGIVARLRNTQPGEPIGLRADDLVALSSALGQDADHVEARIVELLGCTPTEARSLHAEMLRRKLVVPVAGLVAGFAMVAGIGAASAAPALQAAARDTPAATAPVPVAAGHATTGHVAAAHIAAGHIAAGHVVTAVVAPAPTTVVVKPQAASADASSTPPPRPPAAAPETEEHTAPVIPPDNTPMSIPDHETVTIIAP
jgi:transcriptional regulator with XRE-family HTH domain